MMDTKTATITTRRDRPGRPKGTIGMSETKCKAMHLLMKADPEMTFKQLAAEFGITPVTASRYVKFGEQLAKENAKSDGLEEKTSSYVGEPQGQTPAAALSTSNAGRECTRTHSSTAGQKKQGERNEK